MIFNQSLNHNTLALFADISNAESAGPRAFARSQSKALTTNVVKGHAIAQPASRFVSSTEVNRESKSYKDLDERMKMYADPVRRARLQKESQARQDAKDKFMAENGYGLRLTEGLKIAHSMARLQQPSEAHFETRREAIEGVS